jgi:hydroxyacylglutathione hydrolase
MHTVMVLGILADNYAYLVESGGDAVVIDPGEASPVLRALERSGSRLRAVLCTHGHFDHTGGSRELSQRTGCAVMLPDEALVKEDRLAVGSLAFDVLRTRGHSADSVCFYLPPEGGVAGDLFTGDTLFLGGCGRLLTKSPEMMWSSLQALATLPPETKVYPGHDYTLENYEFAVTVEPDNRLVRARLEEIRSLIEADMPTVPSTIGLELTTNPFLRAVQPEMRRALGMEDASDVEVFAELRRRKDRF